MPTPLNIRQNVKNFFNIGKDGGTGVNADQGDGEASTGTPAFGNTVAGSRLSEMEPARVEPSPQTSTVGLHSGDAAEPRKPEAGHAAQAPDVSQRPFTWPLPTKPFREHPEEEEDDDDADSSVLRHEESCPDTLPEAITVTPSSALKSLGSENDLQLQASFPAPPLGSTGELPTNSFGVDRFGNPTGSTTTDYDAMYPPSMHKEFAEMQNMAMAQAQFMGLPPMYCFAPQMWAPYGHVPPHLYPGFPGEGSGAEGGGEMLQETAEDLEQKASELMAVARRMKQTAREARYSTGSIASSRGSQRGSVSSLTEASIGKGHRQASQNMPEHVVQDGERTTVMLRNLPNDYTRDMLLALLDNEGFQGKYNFVYLPMDFKRMAGLGYAFVNMETPEDADNAWQHFDGFKQWTLQSMKVCEVAWGEPLQGLEQHIDRYRNSPVMHEDVQQEFKPVLFSKGQRIDFPGPTKRIRPPRMKYRTPAEGRASTASHTGEAAVMAAEPSGSAGLGGGCSEAGGDKLNKLVD